MSNKQDCHEYEHYKQCKQHNALYIHALTSVSQNSNLHWEMQMVLHSVTHLSLTEGHLQQQEKKRPINHYHRRIILKTFNYSRTV